MEPRRWPRVRRADLWSGALFAALGAVVLWTGTNYSQGVPSRIGPGYVPRLLGFLIGGLGLFLLARAWWATEEIDASLAWRPLIFVLGSILAFALVFQATGLVPAILASVAVANSAAPENRWTTAIGLAAILAFFAWALFVKGLGLPLPVWLR